MRFKTITFLLLIIVGTSLQSCSQYGYEANLEVTVKGLLSGNPRPGLLVQVFYSREDASALIDPITPVLETNDWGEVFIYGLDPGINYYIRIDALLNTSIKRLSQLRSGTNNRTVRVL